HPVVAILGALREHVVERADELRQLLLVVAQAVGQALLEIAGRRVQGAVECALVSVEQIASLLGHLGVDVDRLEPPLGSQPQIELRRSSHHAGVASQERASDDAGLRSAAVSPRSASTRSRTSPTTRSGVDAPAVTPSDTGPSGSQPIVRASAPPS